MNFAIRRSNPEEWAIVRAVIGFVGCHSIAVRQLPVNRRMEVQKRLAHVGVQLPDTGLIRGGSGLSGVIHEIVREEVFEDIEVAFTLDLFGILTDNGFCGFGRGDAVHLLPSATEPRGPATTSVSGTSPIRANATAGLLNDTAAFPLLSSASHIPVPRLVELERCVRFLSYQSFPPHLT